MAGGDGLSRTATALGERFAFVAVVGAVVAYGLWSWDSVDAFARSLDRCPVLFTDFHAHYLPMGASIVELGLPRPNFYYSPLFGLLLAPFAQLSEANAVRAWGLMQGLAVALLVWAPLRLLPAASLGLRALYVGVVLTSFPVLHNFAWGQVSVPLTAGVALAFLLRERGRSIGAGVLLALLIVIKFYVAVALVFFVVRRDVRALLAAVVAGVAFGLVVPALFLGWSHTIDFYRDVAHRLSLVQDAIARNPNSHYLPHVAARFGVALPAFVGHACAAGVVGVTALFVWRGVPHAAALVFVAVHAIVPFVVPTSWPHYFAFLPPAQLALVSVAAALRVRCASVSGFCRAPARLSPASSCSAHTRAPRHTPMPAGCCLRISRSSLGSSST